MKKLYKLCIMAFFVVVFGTTVQAAYTDSMETEVVKVYLENGDYLETVIEESMSRSSSKTGTKTTTYKNASGEAMWYVSVTGTFTYTGSSSTCTSASVAAGTYSEYWKITSKSSSYSGSTATGSATAKKYLFGVATNTITENVRLTCSSTGTLS